MAGIFVRLDADYDSDDRMIEAGPMAELLYIRGLAFCKRKLTDGVITHAQLTVVARSIPRPRVVAQKLCTVGAWETVEGVGYRVVSWNRHNRSSADIEMERKLASEAGTRGNHERWHVGPEGKPSPKCPLCRRVAIGSPDRPPIAPESPPVSPEPETETETIHLPTCSTDDDPTAAKKKDIHRHIVEHRMSTRHVGNPKSYRAKVERDVDQHAERIDELVGKFPNAPVSVIAGAVESGDTRQLAYYAETDDEGDAA